MEETWVGYDDMEAPVSPLFSPSLWGVYEKTLAGIWRTSNNAEAWHSAFGRQVDGAHPGIYKFMDELAKERKHIATKVDHLRKRGELAPRNKTYVRLSQTMKSVCESWKTVPNGFADYMLRVAQHIKIQI